MDTVALTSSIRDDENEDDNAFTSLIVESNSAINKDDYVSVKVIIEVHHRFIHTITYVPVKARQLDIFTC